MRIKPYHLRTKPIPFKWTPSDVSESSNPLASDKMPKSMYSEIHKEFAKRLNSLNNEKWVTFGKFYAELDTYRNKFDKENNSEGLKILEEYDSFVQDLEKKYQIA